MALHGALIIGRLSSIIKDGKPHKIYVQALVPEVITFVMAGVIYVMKY
jgi:hypothetical protein